MLVKNSGQIHYAIGDTVILSGGVEEVDNKHTALIKGYKDLNIIKQQTAAEAKAEAKAEAEAEADAEAKAKAKWGTHGGRQTETGQGSRAGLGEPREARNRDRAGTGQNWGNHGGRGTSTNSLSAR
jgi:hypothetical protein